MLATTGFALLGGLALAAKVPEWRAARAAGAVPVPRRHGTRWLAHPDRVATALLREADHDARRHLLALDGRDAGPVTISSRPVLGHPRNPEVALTGPAGRAPGPGPGARLLRAVRHEAVQTPATLLLVMLWLQACLAGGTTPLRSALAVAGAIALAVSDGRRAGAGPDPVSGPPAPRRPRRTAHGSGR